MAAARVSRPPRAEAYGTYDPGLIPDLIPSNNEGYRVGWQDTLGGIGKNIVEPNDQARSGDHCSAFPPLVKRILFTTLELDAADAKMGDVMPTLLDLYGVQPPERLDGRSRLGRLEERVDPHGAGEPLGIHLGVERVHLFTPGAGFSRRRAAGARFARAGAPFLLRGNSLSKESYEEDDREAEAQPGDGAPPRSPQDGGCGGGNGHDSHTLLLYCYPRLLGLSPLRLTRLAGGAPSWSTLRLQRPLRGWVDC